MPGIPSVHCDGSICRSTDQMSRQDSHPQLSAEEEIAAETSFSAFCKPVELYNILQCRAPSFLQRCLKYRIQAKHKKRIEMTISLKPTEYHELQGHSLFPMIVVLASSISGPGVSENFAAYHFRRAILLSGPGDDGTNQAQAKFVLPEKNKLFADISSGSFSVLFVSFAERGNISTDVSTFLSNFEGECLVGKCPMELLLLAWEEPPIYGVGGPPEVLSTIDMRSCMMKSSSLEKNNCVSFRFDRTSGDVAMLRQLQVTIVAVELGEKERSAYDSYTYNDIPSSSLPHIVRLRTGNVVFNYKYYNNRLEKTEVTEDFSCAFCLAKCASFKGLRYHLCSCHDLFKFEFWVTEEYQAVSVFLKTDTWRSEVVADGVDPRKQTFVFRSKEPRRRKQRSTDQNTKHVHPLVVDPEMLPSINQLQGKTDALSGGAEIVACDESSPNITGFSSATGHSHADPDCVQSTQGNSQEPPSLLQFAKTRKLSAERSDPRNRALLQKRQFFHSHRAQPMALEQVLSDRDSEDEVDDDVADLEDRRMLDDFVDVTKHEKQMMHLWNSFVRKQRVLADGHIPWACEAFSKLHLPDFVRTPTLLWCWKLFMLKLWNHGLLDPRTMNKCNLMLEECQSQGHRAD